jgi:hypothetical protein
MRQSTDATRRFDPMASRARREDTGALSPPLRNSTMTFKSGTILALAFASISMTAIAADPMTPKAGMMPMEHHQSMDTNKDGLLSKEEFTSHHNQMWADMKKTSAGMVDLKTMPMGGSMNCTSATKATPKT